MVDPVNEPLVITIDADCIVMDEGDISMSVLLEDYINRPLVDLLQAFGQTEMEMEELMRHATIDEHDECTIEDEDDMNEWEDMFLTDAEDRHDPRLSDRVIEGEFVEREREK
jgi:hypothetical protein